MDTISRITEEMWPGVSVVPAMSTGATDSLYFRQAGIPMYGVSGLFGDMDDVRSHGRDERIPAVALTAFARAEDRKKSLLAGYQAHLAKPFDMAELILTAAGLLGR
jgi:hypothetical protein